MKSNTLKVVCVTAKNSSKLIVGATYIVTDIYTYSLNKRTVYLKNLGGFSSTFFRLPDGSTLDNLPDFIRTESVNVNKKDYTGQFVKCRCSTGKVLKEGEIYYVDKQIIIKKAVYNQKYIKTKFKIHGIRNLICPDRFEEIPIIEQRNHKLKNINGNKIKTGEKTRKFLLYSEKEKVAILFEILAKVLLNIKNIELPDNVDIIKLMVIKGNKDYALIENDVITFFKNEIGILLNVYKK
jgi:hypothetical protein